MKFRAKYVVLPALVLTVAAIVGVYAIWQNNQQSQPAAQAAQQVEAAAAQRPVDKTDQVIWDYQARVKANSDDVEGYAVLGAAYLQKARDAGDPSYYGKADAVFGEALKRDPQNVDALIGAGTLANARHQFHDGLRLGEQARDINPTIPRIYGVIADSQIELGMYADATATLQTMIDMRPDLSAFSRVSYLRELHGDGDGAIEMMQEAVNAGGPATENSAWVRVQLGNLYFGRGDLARAEQEYQRTLTILPDYVYALAGMARVNAAHGNVAAAEDLYKQAITRMPLPEFVIGLGELQQANGQTTDAAKQYELVRAMQQLFKSNGVDTDLELALFDADHGGDPAATVALAQAAYDRRPSVKAADTLAWALFRTGKPDEARRRADEALRLNTQDALMLFHAGTIAQAQGDATAARQYLQRALALNPHFSPLFAPQAEQALASLEAAATK